MPHENLFANKSFDYAASCRRVCGTYRREAVDRVPILSPISWTPHSDIASEHFGDWRDEENFVTVARLVQEHCDAHPAFRAVAYPRVFEPISYQRFLEAPAEFVEELPPKPLPGGRIEHTTLLHTPDGDLRYVFHREEGIFTNWDMEKPIQTPADAEKMLSVPYRFTPPDPAEYQPFREHREAMGRDAIGGGGVNCMVAMLCGMMPFEQLLEWTLTQPGLLRELADAWLERTREKVDFLLAQGVGPFWSFNGVERASPPMMGPKQWDEWVVPYDGEIMRQIKERAPESIIHVHCHGRVGPLVESFLAMGVDSIDPVEPPPQGDVDIAELKEKYDGRLVLRGNIEFCDMEMLTPDEIEEKVRHAIVDGGKRNVMLFPSAGPHERPTDQFTANAIRYIEAGLKYGRM